MLLCLLYTAMLHCPVAAGSENSLITDLKIYFDSYYATIRDGRSPKSKIDALAEIKDILSKYYKIDEDGDLDYVNRSLDEYLRSHGKRANIFVTSDPEVLQCWIGNLAQERGMRSNIWEKEIEFTVKVIYNLDVNDFVHFLSRGRDNLDAGTSGGVIYYNRDAYEMRASDIWEFFEKRDKEETSRRYDPSQSNRLRKRLYHKSWANLYEECVKEASSQDAKSKFTQKVMSLLMENSLYHEMGHVFAARYLMLNDEAEEEAVAFLTELRYGPLPYESLETITGAGYKSSSAAYNLAGRKVLQSFINYIEEGKRKRDPAYSQIDIMNMGQMRKTESLFKLTPDQIRSISKDIFSQIKPGVGRRD